MEQDGFSLESGTIDGFPIILEFVRRLGVVELLDEHLGVGDARTQLPPSRVIVILLMILVRARAPLYKIAERCERWAPGLLGPRRVPEVALNDDRVGRTLDRLFEADRRAMLTELVLRAVREFDIDLEELHNDSTSITFTGEFEGATGDAVRGHATSRITHGQNKDHRPDLKQLLWILTVSADGGIPVHFRVCDGNTEDSTTHIETWNLLRVLVGSPDFLYVADSKLCTRDNLRHIDGEEGRFLTMLPRSRKEDSRFRLWLQKHTPEWEEVARKPNRRRRDGPEDIIRACADPLPETEGYRLVWFRSSHKIERDAEARRKAIEKGIDGLAKLERRLRGSRCRLRKVEAVQEEAARITRDAGAERWLSWEVSSREEARFRQESRGRPGPDTRYRRIVRTRFSLTWSTRDDVIAQDARCDGIFPLLTNDESLTPAEMLEAYRGKQLLVEQRHHLLKGSLDVAPMFVKSIHRIEAILFVFFVALLIDALIQRELRRGMAKSGIESLPLYPEGRECKATSTKRILELFATVQRHVLSKDGVMVQRFEPELTPLQQQVLSLLGVPEMAFRNL